MRSPLARAASAAFALAAFAAIAPAQKVAMRATLDGGQEVPPNASPGLGTASIVVDIEANTLTLDMTFHGLNAAEVDAHIHGPAPAGVSAGVKFQLPLGNKKFVVWTYSETDEANLLDGLMYINIHSALFPAGEIRGQIVRDPGLQVMTASLDGAQEVPPTGSTGVGTMHVAIDTVANQLSFDLTYTALGTAEIDAHIHGPAAAGVNAPVKFPLALGNKKIGVWNYPQSDEADILAGLMYVNIHSGGFPSGEIRGQILPAAANVNAYCTAKVTSLGCTPAINGTGKPSASAGIGFTISTFPVPGASVGIYFYSTTGTNNVPFQGGTLCLSGTVLRTPGQFSGGAFGVCNGGYGFDFNTFALNSSDPALVAGQIVFLQTWFRDPPASFGSGLSNALKFELLP
jgi:hypothetical protein